MGARGTPTPAESPPRRRASGLLRRPSTFLGLPARRRLLVVEVALLLGAARFLVRFAPLRWYIRALGARESESAADLAPEQDALAREIGWAVRTVAPSTPWTSACLPQAMAAKWMLDRRGVPATLYLGLGRDDDRALLAHAWLRAGRRVLTGRESRPRFTRVASFA